MEIRVKRVYEPAATNDGYRIYVDRLWPRGLSHANFHYDLWDKDIAPSTELRQWFHEDPENRWQEFFQNYTRELSNNPAVAKLEELIARQPVVTLLFSSRDESHNNATVLKKFLESHFSQGIQPSK